MSLVLRVALGGQMDKGGNQGRLLDRQAAIKSRMAFVSQPAQAKGLPRKLFSALVSNIAIEVEPAFGKTQKTTGFVQPIGAAMNLVPCQKLDLTLRVIGLAFSAGNNF